MEGDKEQTLSPQSSPPVSPPLLTLKTETTSPSHQEEGITSSPLTHMTSELTIHQSTAIAAGTTSSSQTQLPSLGNSSTQPQTPTTANVPLPCGKIINYCPKHPHIEITLDGKELWDDFYRRGTEMIVNRAGRRMFPGFAVTVTGLKPKSKYTMKLDVMLADNHRFKFLNARWLAVGSAEPQSPYKTYTHQDSPNSGSFWMRHGVSFKKLKITNNKDKPGPNALLHSMHKYFLRLMIEEEKKIINSETKQHQTTLRPILSMEFPETTFIAVTAYQNEEVTQLKITNNPFAKAFRENAADMDWDTAQALYGNSSGSYMGQPAPLVPTGNYNYLMSPSPSPWAIHSPSMLSPHYTTLTGPVHHSNILHGGATSTHYSPDQYRSTVLPPTPHAEGFFQWPPTGPIQQAQHSSISRTNEMLSSAAATYLPPLVPLHHHIVETASPPPTEVLPDFSSTFAPTTSAGNPHS